MEFKNVLKLNPAVSRRLFDFCLEKVTKTNDTYAAIAPLASQELNLSIKPNQISLLMVANGYRRQKCRGSKLYAQPSLGLKEQPQASSSRPIASSDLVQVAISLLRDAKFSPQARIDLALKFLE